MTNGSYTEISEQENTYDSDTNNKLEKAYKVRPGTATSQSVMASQSKMGQSKMGRSTAAKRK